MQTLAFIPSIGPFEWFVILVIGLLIFGRRLPEVARSLGRGVVEFRKGLKGIEEEPETPPAPRNLGDPALRPPLTSSGQDARVGKADVVDVEHVEPRPQS